MSNGSVYTGMVMQLYKEKHFAMQVVAADKGSISSNTTLRVSVATTQQTQTVIYTQQTQSVVYIQHTQSFS